jgi:hypothetical protein
MLIADRRWDPSALPSGGAAATSAHVGLLRLGAAGAVGRSSLALRGGCGGSGGGICAAALAGNAARLRSRPVNGASARRGGNGLLSTPATTSRQLVSSRCCRLGTAGTAGGGTIAAICSCCCAGCAGAGGGVPTGAGAAEKDGSASSAPRAASAASAWTTISLMLARRACTFATSADCGLSCGGDMGELCMLCGIGLSGKLDLAGGGLGDDMLSSGL